MRRTQEQISAMRLNASEDTATLSSWWLQAKTWDGFSERARQEQPRMSLANSQGRQQRHGDYQDRDNVFSG